LAKSQADIATGGRVPNRRALEEGAFSGDFSRRLVSRQVFGLGNRVYYALWTCMPVTPELIGSLNALLVKPRPYPHATIDKSGRKKQATRMLKVVCPECDYTVRTTQQWIDTRLPICVCGIGMELAE
jgi:hypothetical protein